MADYAASPNDAGGDADPQALARKWIAELDQAEKDPDRVNWLKRCKAIIKLYKEDRSKGQMTKKRFALFWSNIQTIAPAIYARTPTAVVSRRFKDTDPVGRVASEVLERALNFTLEEIDFGSVMTGTRDEYLLTAQSQAWVRYVPTISTKLADPDAPQITDEPESYETVDWEEVVPDRVHYEDFLHNTARSWPEVCWVARRVYVGRKQGVQRFGDAFKQVPLEWCPEGEKDAADEHKKAVVYEIWDRESKRVIWVCKGYTSAVLDARDDPLKLKDFFPCPKPLYGTLGPDSLVPTPDFIYYQDQADEIDNLTTRIDKLIDALRVRGFYDGSKKQDLNQLVDANDNMLIPVDSWAALGDSGGIRGIVDWFPVEQIAAVLKGCFDARRQLIEDVYQVTGISDIQRGDSDPNETAAAQQLKATWGSVRVRDRQKELARFARDVIRIMGEIIASRFDQKTLADMTDVKLLTKAERDQMVQQIQAQQQQAMAQQPPPQPGQPPAPPPQPPPIPEAVQKQLSEPTWDDVLGLLRNPSLRAFRIDIETDSTIEPDDQEEKQRRIEFVTAVGKYLAESLPVVQASPAILPVIAEGLKFLVQGFRVGREMEDTIDRAMDELQQQAAQPQQPPVDPVEQAKAEAAKLQGQAAIGKVQNDAQGNQIEAARVQSDHQIGIAQVQAENTRSALEHTATIHDTISKAEDRRAVREINDQTPIKADTQ